jgi:lipopolysaccharide cholinephosphotransferase
MTFAQKFNKTKEKYLDYDFDSRKLRRDPYININIAKENLLLLKDIFDKNNIKFWLIYGTLLGAVRDKDFIKHDFDTDLGLFYSDIDKLYDIKQQLESNEFQLIRTKFPDDLITFMRKDEYIDLGLFNTKKSLFTNFWIYQKNKEKFSYFKKFDQINFLGDKFLVPNNYLNFIKEHYGKNWKVPIKDFPQLTSDFLGFKRRVKYFLQKSLIGKKIIVIYKIINLKKDNE